ncbi:MAG: ABC transporter substrate-binding protein [Acidimicrobiales bacterium]
MRRRLAVLAAVGSATLLAACGSSTATGTAGAKSGPLGAACAPASLKTLHKGVLTLGADDPLYPPWYIANNPTNGKGFEDAVAYAVAHELGYSDKGVKWVRVTFNNAIAPGPKTFDYDLDEFSIDAQRRQAVDFSSPYYTVHEAVVVLAGTSAAHAHTLTALRHLVLGAQIATTDYQTIVTQIKPTTTPRVYNSTSDAFSALEDHQIQGLVVDLPTAFEVTQGEAKGSTILGQLPSPPGHPEQFGIVLDKGSPLTSCVSKAVDAITADGTLAKLTTKWLNQVAGAPVIH